MSGKTLLVLGARSDIGMAIAHRFAKEGFDIQLAARNAKELEADCSDINIRHNVNATWHEFDALDLQSHEEFVAMLPALPLVALCAIGYMGEQEESEKDSAKTALVMRSNYEGPAGILALLANHFEARGFGALIGISSVAGDRGRAANYIYGSAKAGFTAFLSGLRNRLAGKGIRVITVKPGFVATKMTEGLNLPPILTAKPDELANAIYKAYSKNTNILVYRPIWILIMLIIKNIPEFIFKKTKI